VKTTAGAGERMLNGFEPIMQPRQVQTTATYNNDVFVPLGKVSPMMSAANVEKFQRYLADFGGMQTDAQELVPMLAQALVMTAAQVHAMLATQLPAMAAMLQSLPDMQRDFGALLGTMQDCMTIATDTGEGGANAAVPRPQQTGVHEHPLPDDLVELIAVRFRVLGEPMRIKLLDRLREGEATVDSLVAATGASQQNVSKHLGVLLREGIVGRRKDGNYVHYSIVDHGVFALCASVCGDLQRRLDALRDIVGPSAPGA